MDSIALTGLIFVVCLTIAWIVARIVYKSLGDS